jgi:hypothetical protein
MDMGDCFTIGLFEVGDNGMTRRYDIVRYDEKISGWSFDCLDKLTCLHGGTGWDELKLGRIKDVN